MKANTEDKQPLKPYSEMYNKELSENEVKQIDHNLIGYIELLIRLNEQQKKYKSSGK